MIRAGVVAAVAIGVLGGPALAQRQPGWEVRLAERVELVAGASGSLTLSIAVDRGLVVSRDAAVIVDVAVDPAVTVKRRRLGRGDAVDPEADTPRFAIPVRGETAGEFAMRIRVRFWVCAAKTCRPIDVHKVTTVSVTAAS